MRHIPTNSVAQIVPAAETAYTGLTFSPDGNYIYFTRVEKEPAGVHMLYQIPVLGGAPRLIVTNVASAISFSPDGRRFAFRRENSALKTSSLLILDSDGSHEQKLVELTLPATFADHPSWSPDGKVIAIMEFFGQKTGELGQFIAVDVATGKTTKIASLTGVGQVDHTSWLPDGSGLLAATVGPNTNWKPQIGFISYPGGEFRRITNDLNDYFSVSATRDGRSLVTVAEEQSSNIWVMPASATAGQAVQISSGKNDAVSLDWTGDGQILSFSVGSQGFEFDLRKSDGAGRAAILTDTSPVQHPSACGDSRHIVFAAYHPQDGVNLWRMDSGGGNLKRITDGQYNTTPACSPDGQWVAYQSFNGAGNAMMKVSIDGGPPTSLGFQSNYRPAVSPDGKMIAFYVDGSAPDFHPKWIVVPASGGAPIYTLNAEPSNAGRLRFTPDGKSLAYLGDEHGVSNIWAVPLTGGPPKQITNFKSDLIFDFAFSRDGKSLALSRGQVSRDVVLLTDTAQ
jgi:Tol biopolymer transport system component